MSCLWAKRPVWNGTTGYECQARSASGTTFHQPFVLKGLGWEFDHDCTLIAAAWIWMWVPSAGASRQVGSVHYVMLVDFDLRLSQAKQDQDQGCKCMKSAGQSRTWLVHYGWNLKAWGLWQQSVVWSQCCSIVPESDDPVRHSRCTRKTNYWEAFKEKKTLRQVFMSEVAKATSDYYEAMEFMESCSGSSIYIFWNDFETVSWQMDWPSDSNVVVILQS